jgi:hypothetical protein
MKMFVGGHSLYFFYSMFQELNPFLENSDSDIVRKEGLSLVPMIHLQCHTAYQRRDFSPSEQKEGRESHLG